VDCACICDTARVVGERGRMVEDRPEMTEGAQEPAGLRWARSAGQLRSLDRPRVRLCVAASPLAHGQPVSRAGVVCGGSAVDMLLIDAMAIYGESEDAVYSVRNVALALTFGHDQYYYAARDDAPQSGSLISSTFPEVCLAWMRRTMPDALTSNAWEADR
jgi:hypothetical protein